MSMISDLTPMNSRKRAVLASTFAAAVASAIPAMAVLGSDSVPTRAATSVPAPDGASTPVAPPGSAPGSAPAAPPAPAPAAQAPSFGPPAKGEVIEAVIARVNDDIITKTDLGDAEQDVVSDLAAHHTGDDLEKELTRAKTELLKDLITKKLLVQQAERIYDMSKMQDAFLREFKENQKIASNPELEKLLKGENMTMEEFKKKLIEVNAPSSVIQYEVRDKISVSDGEIENFYKSNSALLASPDKVSFREIVLLSEGRSRDETAARALALAGRARGGADFELLAKENSQVESNLRGGLLGPFKKGELAPALEKVVFAMKAGAVSDPIEVAGAFHVVRCEGREEASMPPLETAKEKISLAIERQKFNDALDEYILGLWRRSEIHVADEFVERVPVAFRKFLK